MSMLSWLCVAISVYVCAVNAQTVLWHSSMDDAPASNTDWSTSTSAATLSSTSTGCPVQSPCWSLTDTGSISRQQATAGYQRVVLQYSFIGVSLNGQDTCTLDASTDDGVSWTTLNTGTATALTSYAFGVAADDNANGVIVRLSTSGTGHSCLSDELTLSADMITAAPTALPTIATSTPTTAAPTTVTPTTVNLTMPAPTTTAATTDYEVILNHKSVANGYFSSTLRTTGLENEADPDANTYSIIGNFDATTRADYQNVNGAYQFKLQFTYADGTQDILEWTQTSWITEQDILGFTLIQATGTDGLDYDILNDTDAGQFRGLGLNVGGNSASSYLDGNGGLYAQFWQAVGEMASWVGQGIPGIPGLEGSVNDAGKGAAQRQTLWIYAPASPTSTTPTTNTPTTLVPTSSPVTTQPTASPVINIGSVSAWWSCSYLKLYIEMDANAAVYIFALTDNVCSQIFDENTANLLGSNAVCTWTFSEEDTGEGDIMRLITVSLASDSRIGTDDSIVMQSGVFAYGEEQVVLPSALHINLIGRKCLQTAPILNFQPPTAIGVCDDLVLDLRGQNVANLGGRPAASIRWDILFNDGHENRSLTVHDALYVSIENKNLSAGQLVHYSLSVTSWYNRSVSVTGAINKSNHAVPSIQLSFPAIFDAHTTAISIESTITFVDSCLNTTQQTLSSFFRYSWTVKFVSESSSIPINTDMFAALQELLTHSDRTLTIADVHLYMQRGAAYAFTLSIDCDTSTTGYECSAASTPAIIRYQFSPIVCQISDGNKAWTVTESSVAAGDLSLTMIGDEWSFDPDGNALSFQWGCYEGIENQDCSSLLTWPQSPQSLLSFENENASSMFSVNASYEFEISLIVSDASVLSRAQCTDFVTLALNVLDDDDDDAQVVQYLVSISATANSISSTDRLRLIASVTLLNVEPLSDDDSHLTYEWSTQNDKLNASEINAYRLNAQSAKNLVLNGDVLQSGATYEFVLNIFDSTSSTQQSVGSASIAIYVRSPPIISSQGFTIDDGTACNFSFSDLTDSLLRSFTFYVSADGDETPLTYAFDAMLSLSSSHRLHSQVLYQPVLDHVLLPIACEYSLSATVTDFEGAQASQSIECCVSVASHDCFSYAEVVEAYFDDALLSDSQKHRFLFQSAFNVLHYLSHIGDDECKHNLFFDELIDVMNEYFAADVIDFCAANNFMSVIELAQTLTKWLNVGIELSLFNSSNADCGHFDMVYELLTQVLDPCETIRAVITDSDQLQVSPQSVVTNAVMVFYEGRDITAQLSLLLTQQQYLPAVYDVVDAFVDYLSIESVHTCLSSLPSQSIVDFLESVLYISGLSGISTTIPSEVINIKSNNFEVLTIRDEVIHSLNVTVKDVEIELGIDGNGQNGNKDVIIYGLEHQAEQGTSFVGSEAEDRENCFEANNGTLDEHQVSITVVNSTSETDIDVTMTFELDGDYNNAVCVWWNEERKEWDSTGCHALIDASRNVMVCRCNHLTTFATISHLMKRSGDECDTAALSNEYNEVMLAFAIVFLIIFGWIFFNCCRLKIRGVLLKKMIKHRSMQVLAVTAVVAIFYAVQCALLYLQSSVQAAEQQLVIFLIVFLLLPLILYYLIFSFVVTTWINVVYAMAKSNVIIRFKKTLRWFTLIVCVVYCAIIVLVIVSADFTDIIKIGELFWISIMAMSILFFTLYGARIISTIHNANKAVKKRATQSALRRISMAVIGLNIFFVCEGAQTVFFSFYPERLTRYWQFGNLALNVMCLSLICFLYSQAWNAILSDDQMIGSSVRTSRQSKKVGSKSEKTEKSQTSMASPKSEKSFPFPPPVPSLQVVQSTSFEHEHDEVQLSSAAISPVSKPKAVSALRTATQSACGKTPDITFYGANRVVSTTKDRNDVQNQSVADDGIGAELKPGAADEYQYEDDDDEYEYYQYEDDELQI